ncbi:membrane-associated protein, putative [Bodo saltans]|uniref:Membrane-associated protein, putative n=1 Tax=Bodo saltans TaxID=75058 RepID=A0A0S4JTT7_BODSA|nr:membrane-associated protein, putative [Bodo saltans]|eukprot:CUG91965.1 membrane-associated protein, putative [Bodo saltans]
MTGIAVIDTSGVGCPTAMLIIGIAYIVAAAVIMLLRVYRRPLDNLLTAVANIAFAAVCILKGVAPSHADVAAAIQIVQSACLFLKVLYSLYVWLRERPLLEVEREAYQRSTPRFDDEKDEDMEKRGAVVTFSHRNQLQSDDESELIAMEASADPANMQVSFADGGKAHAAAAHAAVIAGNQMMRTPTNDVRTPTSPAPLLSREEISDDDL